MLIPRDRKLTGYFGSMGTHHHVDVRYFDRFADAVAHARARGCCLCGVEVVPPELRPVLAPATIIIAVRFTCESQPSGCRARAAR